MNGHSRLSFFLSFLSCAFWLLLGPFFEFFGCFAASKKKKVKFRFRAARLINHIQDHVSPFLSPYTDREKKHARSKNEHSTLFPHIHTSSSYLFAYSHDERNDDGFSRTDGRRDGLVVVVVEKTTGTKLRDGFGFIGFVSRLLRLHHIRPLVLTRENDTALMSTQLSLTYIREEADCLRRTRRPGRRRIS